MCCLLTSLFFLGPRAAIIVWWLLQPVRWQATFDNFILPLFGFLLLPWTTLAYVVVAPGGVSTGEWFFVGLALVIDVLGWTGGGYGNRRRLAGAQ